MGAYIWKGRTCRKMIDEMCSIAANAISRTPAGEPDIVAKLRLRPAS